MILNYTTKIDPEQTISEIQKMLSKHNVTGMYTEYDGPNVSAVSFKILVDGRPMGFKLPCNWRSVEQIFKDQDSGKRKRTRRWNIKTGQYEAVVTDYKDQSIRTAWRVIKDWIEAQLALVEINMVTLPQVFLPYTIMKDNRTLSEHIASDPGFLLGDGK